jgi:hypothetical protein
MAWNVGGSIRVAGVADAAAIAAAHVEAWEKRMSALFPFRCWQAFPWIAERKFGAAS